MNQLGLALRIPIMTQKVTVAHEHGKIRHLTEHAQKTIAFVRLGTNQPFFMNNKGESMGELFDNFVAQIPDELKDKLFFKNSRAQYEEIEQRLYDTFGAVIEGDTITKAANILGVRLPRNRWETGELSRYISYAKQASSNSTDEIYKIKVLSDSRCHKEGITLNVNDEQEALPIYEHYVPLKPGQAYEDHFDPTKENTLALKRTNLNLIACCPLGLMNVS